MYEAGYIKEVKRKLNKTKYTLKYDGDIYDLSNVAGIKEACQ